MSSWLVAEVETVYNGPTEVPGGRFAVMGDPQGAVFSIWTGAYED